MPSPNQISVPQLLRLIGTPDCPVLIDVCIYDDFFADPRLIPGAKRFPHTNIMELIPLLAGKRVVVICQKGLKLSAGASSLLRSEGISAEYLEGGNFAWREVGAPLVPGNTEIALRYTERSLWVTRHRPKIDRIACPWLIRRFIDPDARFLFVSPGEVESVAEKFNAVPFDIDGAHFGHKGEFCTFDTFLEEFKLNTDPLLNIARIIRGADTSRLDLTEQSAGLLAMSLGLSRMFKDDHQQLEAGFLFYDALYRWARDASEEKHLCPRPE